MLLWNLKKEDFKGGIQVSNVATARQCKDKAVHGPSDNSSAKRSLVNGWCQNRNCSEFRNERKLKKQKE